MRIQRQFGILIQCIFLVSLLLGCSQNNVAAETTEFLKYEDKNNNFSINYPSDWTVDIKQKDVSVLFESPKESVQDVFTENITVKAFTLPDEATSPMEKYKDGIIDTIKKQTPGIEVINTSNLTINDLPALQILISGKRDSVDISYQMTVVFKGKIGYVLGFTCLNGDLDKYSTISNEIINSFKVIK